MAWVKQPMSHIHEWQRPRLGLAIYSSLLLGLAIMKNQSLNMNKSKTHQYSSYKAPKYPDTTDLGRGKLLQNISLNSLYLSDI